MNLETSVESSADVSDSGKAFTHRVDERYVCENILLVRVCHVEIYIADEGFAWTFGGALPSFFLGVFDEDHRHDCLSVDFGWVAGRSLI